MTWTPPDTDEVVSGESWTPPDSDDVVAKKGSKLALTISKYARPVLEMGGMVGGGLVGAGATGVTIGGVPAGAAVGGVLGYAGGKSAADFLDRSMGLKGPSEGGPLMESAENIKEGAVMEAAGQVGGAILSPLAKAAKPYASKALEGAKKFAVELTPAQIKGSKPLALVESLLEKMPLSSGIIQRFRAKQGAQLERAAQDLISNLATVETKEATGTAAQEAIKQKMFKRLSVRDKLFDRLTKAVPKDTMIATDSVKDVAERLYFKESQLPLRDQNKAILKYLEDKMRSPQVSLSFEGAKALRERLTAQIGPYADTPEKQVYKQIKNALDSDIASFAEKSGGLIEKAWKKANSFHGAVKQLADDPNIKSIVNSANPGAIVNSLLNSRNTLQMRLLRKAMPEVKFQKLQGAIVDRLFEGGIQQTASDALASNVKRYGDEFLEAAITKPKLERLKEFADVIGSIKSVERIAGNPSGTAQVMIAFSQGAYLISHPVSGAMAVVAPPIMAKMYLSDVGKNLIKEGIRLSTSTAKSVGRASGIATALISMANKEKVKEKIPESPTKQSKPSPSLIGPQSVGASPSDQGPTASLLSRQAIASYLKGDNRGAASLALKAIQQNPEDREAMGLLEGLARKGDYGYKFEERVKRSR